MSNFERLGIFLQAMVDTLLFSALISKQILQVLPSFPAASKRGMVRVKRAIQSRALPFSGS
jgi:hypothetical protein